MLSDYFRGIKLMIYNKHTEAERDRETERQGERERHDKKRHRDKEIEQQIHVQQSFPFSHTHYNNSPGGDDDAICKVLCLPSIN